MAMTDPISGVMASGCRDKSNQRAGSPMKEHQRDEENKINHRDTFTRINIACVSQSQTLGGSATAAEMNYIKPHNPGNVRTHNQWCKAEIKLKLKQNKHYTALSPSPTQPTSKIIRGACCTEAGGAIWKINDQEVNYSEQTTSLSV